ncbi:MAG: TonB-dependent receptor [Candidatus Acidiferrales bacterium]
MSKICFAFLGFVALLLALLPIAARAQQTLGAINGTVTDNSGAIVQGAAIKVRNVGTNLAQAATTRNDGSFSLKELPIGTYVVTISKAGFKTEEYSQILVQGNLTTTVNVTLQPGAVTSTVTVTATPLLNETDTSNGYTLHSDLIESTPLGTGSFTQLAILAPGVNADFLAGSGTNAGLGNQDIWANGQRDTSNSFSFNDVNGNNLFNGKSSSSVSDNRFVLNTGGFLDSTTEEYHESTSVYDAIGQGLPTPPPETIEELHVSTSMYDASEGSHSGAHVEVQTKTGSNDLHGQAYEYHQTSGWNAAPFFSNAAGIGTPALKRNTFGATLGGPILKDKLFFFVAYQGQRAVDQDDSISDVDVPPDLTDARDAASLATVANTDFGTSLTAANINSVALAIMNAKLPNGNYLIPSPTITNQNQAYTLGYDGVIQGPSTHFSADQVNGNIDYNFSEKDRISGKYYFQRDPTYAPFAISQVEGFPQQMNAGAQVFSLTNTVLPTPNTSWIQRFGFIREKAFASTQQGFTPSDFGISEFGLNTLPGIHIGIDDENVGNSLYLGAASNTANAGAFQNQFEWATSYNWVLGRHSLGFGAQYDYTQLNVVNKNNQLGLLGFQKFSDFLEGNLCSPSNSCYAADSSVFVNGETNRYFRSNQLGLYAQDTFRLKSNLTLSLGLRWDWNGPLYEKYGKLVNFNPADYSYDASTDTITNTGLVVAGNNPDFATKGASDSTLTARQWGFAPRVGIVYAPSFIKNFVVRAGFGMYYDRGEYFAELSPSAGSGIGGPFGVTTEQPFAVPYYSPPGATFQAPFGTTAPPAPVNSLSGVASLLPNIAQLEANTTPFCIATGQSYCGPFQFAGYDPNSKLPYSENWTLDLQWQPSNDIVVNAAYVGNHGVHEVIPVPFNQPGIATPSNPINGEIYSYGYNVPGVSAENQYTLVAGYADGNADLRAPYIGYDPNSQFNEGAGISNYDALQLGLTKRLQHGLTLAASYTWSHVLDEQSGLGLFFNGNSPTDLKSAYGSADFDRTHVFSISYRYQFPKAAWATGAWNQVVNGWGLSGLTVAESGQPYSVYDYTGGAGSIYWGAGDDQVTNPIIPVGGVGSTSTKVELQGTLGVNPGKPVLNVNAFGLPLLTPGSGGVPPCDPVTGVCDSYETGYGDTGRNIFRGPFQSRFDFGIFKDFKVTERFGLRFDAQAFNIFNHPSFDTPNNDVKFNPYYADPPTYSSSSSCVPATGAYRCPPSGQLGLIQHTLGSPRFLQMALHLMF